MTLQTLSSSRLYSSSLIKKFSIAILVFFVSCSLFYYVFTQPQGSQAARDPDRAQFHLVVSHYDTAPAKMRVWIDAVRSMPNIQRLHLKVMVYTKHQAADLAQLKELIDADEVVQLPNLGREGGTYLHHLLQVYNKPPRYTMFSRAAPAGQSVFDTPYPWFYDAIRHNLSTNTGFLDLCETTGKYTGEFIVSGNRIAAKPRWMYEHLRDLAAMPEDHWTKGENGTAVLRKPDSRRKSLFDPTLETLWTTIFGCIGQSDEEGCQSTC